MKRAIIFGFGILILGFIFVGCNQQGATTTATTTTTSTAASTSTTIEGTTTTTAEGTTTTTAAGLTTTTAAGATTTTTTTTTTSTTSTTLTGWNPVGGNSINNYSTGSESLYIYQGIPYVVWSGPANMGTLMKYENSTWEIVGETQFSEGNAEYTRVVIDENDGTPYVIYQDVDDATGEATVKKYNSGSNAWEVVGTAGFSDGTAHYTNIVIDNGTIYVAYEDHSGGPTALTCMTFNGTSWAAVGNERFTGTAESIDQPYLYVNNSTPYIAYQDYLYPVENARKAAVQTYNGNSWVNIGSGLSDGQANSICLTGSNEVLYLAFNDDETGIDRKLRVKKYENSSWTDVGSDTGISSGVAQHISITVANCVPYVAYHDADQDNKCTVQRFVSGSWEVIGEAGFSNGAVGDTSIFVYEGVPYVAYRDASYGPYGDAAVLMKYTE